MSYHERLNEFHSVRAAESIGFEADEEIRILRHFINEYENNSQYQQRCILHLSGVVMKLSTRSGLKKCRSWMRKLFRQTCSDISQVARGKFRFEETMSNKEIKTALKDLGVEAEGLSVKLKVAEEDELLRREREKGL